MSPRVVVVISQIWEDDAKDTHRYISVGHCCYVVGVVGYYDYNLIVVAQSLRSSL